MIYKNKSHAKKIIIYNYGHRNLALTFFVLLSVFTQSSCKKFIEVKPPITSITSDNAFSTDATAAAVLTGIYTNFSNLNIDYWNPSFSTIFLYPALSADELQPYDLTDPFFSPYYLNDLNATSVTYWNNLYSTIYVCNSAIEGINASSKLSPLVKQQLLGEAKFVRAFCYFDLVNLYGSVPLPLESDYKKNSLLPRSPTPKVYQQIITDLTDAQSLLSDSYLKSDAMTSYANGTEERVRPTKWAANALLARVYLYNSDYANSEVQATSVINSSLFGLNNLGDVFKKNSTETIWSLQPVNNDVNSNTGEGALFVLPNTGPNSFQNMFYLTDNLINSFEINDNRKIEWIGNVTVDSITYYYPLKYKIGLVNTSTDEYSVILRLGEQYLIRAEARAQLNKVSEAQADLNTIRLRAGLRATTINDKTSLLSAILHERQVELFTEGGHRWLDLKRTNNIDAVMNTVAIQKGGIWSSYKSLYPIPQDELARDPNLIQNAGY